jgi:hypothetical protein
MVIVLPPKISILMPIRILLLRILQVSIIKNVSNTSDLLINGIQVTMSKSLRQLDDFIPHSLCKIDLLFGGKVNVFEANTAVMVNKAQNF